MKQLNPSIKLHLLIGALTSVWIFLFAFFIRPYEHGSMDFTIWITVSIGFSVLAFVCYAIVSFIQKIIYQQLSKWSFLLEVGMLLLFFVLYTVATYTFYRSSLVKGFYDFTTFLREIILTSMLILTPILILFRTYAIKLIPSREETITIKGENKLDILKIKPSDLICISNSQNYVEIFYLDQNELQSKLIRTSLKKLQADFDFLLQIHRSHLINPSHFKSWKDASTILLTQMELPVSKNYKEQVLAL
ncbi:LytTr DNA-binding domain-containing protein [Kordia periserrulae]|uniref:LytTr DNA-binding domain-containing protein n=1 Tax=Kordia periserrulae TaxID=701523 RepID=A0A2T6BZE4_9FLAO|nr:LytTR family DNA-binding domain-containing protein [Kordia periserrulae]PTX61445.1 LytTr DNA-binding domain-containing protein [Kordia periserrulae]